MPTPNEALLSLINQAHDEHWEELDLSGMGLTELPIEIGMLTGLKRLVLGKWDRETRTFVGNSFTEIPAVVFELTHLEELRISGNQLTRIPDKIAELQDLTKLHISANQLTTISSSIISLKKIKFLFLDSNRLRHIPESITQLESLTALHLNFNQIRIISDSIKQLSNLTQLDLSFNQITQIPDAIAQLSNLTSLYINDNQIAIIPNAIMQLSNLIKLHLNRNQITIIPDAIIQLSNLIKLELWGNQIAVIPDSIAQLSNLTTLHLNRNQIAVIPDSIAQLSNLTTLHLNRNQIAVIPDSIGQLTNLTTLHLSANQIAVIPDAIAQLSNLTYLDLRSNQITEIPESFVNLKSLEKLDLHNNSIKPIIPEEILVPVNPWGIPDAQPIFDYYFNTHFQDLYEAKLFIVGEGEVGKTTLAQKLLNPNYKLPVTPEDISTQSIDIHQWNFDRNDTNYRVNIWDFGGQEIYHQTHQFFLTERALYILVADDRKQNNDHLYWLEIIRLLGKNSPVLILQNQKNDQHCTLNLTELTAEFSNLITPSLALNLAKTDKLDQTIDTIQHHIKTLLHSHSIRYPIPWLKIRTALEADTRNHIDLRDYETLCAKNGITDRQKRLNLSQFLHNLGICLHFQNNPVLKNRLILKPNWATTALYKILNNARIKTQTFGHFNNQDLDKIWHEDQYQDMRYELLQLMLEFKVCYEIPRRPGHYIAPHLLTQNTPDYPWTSIPGDLSLRYHYKRFMPKGILTRFIVEQHKRIENVSTSDSAHVWKTGVILSDNHTRAEIIEKYNDRTITLRFSGSHQRDLLTQLKTTLDDIHEDFTRRDRTTPNPLDYEIVIPCNCSTCNVSTNPHFFSLENLYTFINKRIDTMQCYKSGDEINVRRLLDNTIDPIQERRKHDRDRYGSDPDDRVSDRYNDQRQTIIIAPNFNNTNQQDQTMTEQSPKTTTFNLPNANIGAIATDNAQATVTDNTFTQTHNTSTEDLLKLITALRQTSIQFPTEIKQEIDSNLEDLEAEIIKPERDRNPTRIKKRIAAIVTTIGLLASGISGVADFTNTTIDLGSKLNIDVPALMGK
jgi:internalin A